MTAENRNEPRQELRRLPSVEALANRIQGVPHALAVEASRAEIEAAREQILDGAAAPLEDELLSAAAHRARSRQEPSLRRVINATGVVLHTNLGRAPLPPAAVDAVAAIAGGYSNLEYDLLEGSRGSRGSHVDSLLCELSGAEDAMAVNNNAAAVMLALAALAGKGEVLVSRGQLIEIGGSFRIPDILANSGATLVEVGTTNRTRIEDYATAVGERTTAILNVHQSNFQIVGFAEQAPVAELAALAHERGLAMIDDLGSGSLTPLYDEPTLNDAVAAGSDLVCCSGDKLLGGPQAGILVGAEEAIAACRKHPLARAMRLDKLQLAALEATLRTHREDGRSAIPAVAMIDASASELEQRARLLAEAIGASAEVGYDRGAPGGGALPDVHLEGPVCLVDPSALGAESLLARLRAGRPPVVARIVRGRVALDPRTLTEDDVDQLIAAVRAALS